MKRTPKSLKDFDLIKPKRESKKTMSKKPLLGGVEIELEIEHKPAKKRMKDGSKTSCYAEGGKVKDNDWIEGAIKKPGALRKELHVKKGEKIPEKKLDKAMHSDDALLRKRARLAKTLKGFKK